MSRTIAERVADVERLVAAARAVARDATLVDPLVRTTRLSRQGVRLALAEHLETAPTDADLRSLVDRAGDTSNVHVLLSSTVFVGALRAVALARAAAERVTVWASRQEPVFARALVDRAGDPGLSMGDRSVEALRGGEIHVYGRDATIAELRAHVAEGVRVRGHGTGLGVAVVTRTSALAESARAIARDVAPFDQRGCLSPRLVILLGSRGAEELCGELHGALAAMEERVPRGALEPEESAAATRYAASVAFAGRLWPATTHLVGLAPRGAPLTLPPPGRHLHVVTAEGAEEARALLANVARFVVAIGTDAPAVASGLTPHTARISALGKMQTPPLDGPVDLREWG